MMQCSPVVVAREDFVDGFAEESTLSPRAAASPTGNALRAAAASERLSRFRRVRRLRCTLYGETTLCQDEALGHKPVVLKRLSIPALQSEESSSVRENPLCERAVIRLLEDPLVARAPGREHVVEYEREAMFTQDDSVYIAMEYCAGGDLYEYVTSQPQRKLPEMDALRLFAQITRGLSFLHAHGVAHRDLSLENVLLQGGCAKICDFGLSADASVLSQDVCGKFFYMAPEVSDGLPYDPKRADVWSLGVLLFIMLTGSPLFADEAPRAPTLRVLGKYGVGKILELWHLQRHFSRSTVSLLSSMLQMQPERRLTVDQLTRHPALRAFSPRRQVSAKSLAD